jgi:hypothetical protein
MMQKNFLELSISASAKKAGFISCGKESYYFRTADCQIPVDELQHCLKVKFILQPGFDPKNKKTIVAVNIHRSK